LNRTGVEAKTVHLWWIIADCHCELEGLRYG
jgi:hypothetical protein